MEGVYVIWIGRYSVQFAVNINLPCSSPCLRKVLQNSLLSHRYIIWIFACTPLIIAFVKVNIHPLHATGQGMQVAHDKTAIEYTSVKFSRLVGGVSIITLTVYNIHSFVRTARLKLHVATRFQKNGWQSCRLAIGLTIVKRIHQRRNV